MISNCSSGLTEEVTTTVGCGRMLRGGGGFLCGASERRKERGGKACEWDSCEGWTLGKCDESSPRP